MTQTEAIQVEEIVDDLYDLKKQIDSLLNFYCEAERTFCDGDSAYELQQECQNKAALVKKQVRMLAIAMGVHLDFLEEYTELCKQYGIKLTVA